MSQCLRRVLTLALGGSLAVGCLDISRLDYVPRERDGGAAGDAGEKDGSGVASCRACVTGDGGACAADFAACTADVKCRSAASCAIDRGCLNVKELQARIVCTTPCLQAAGIASSSDPSLAIALTVNQCALDKCQSACNPR